MTDLRRRSSPTDLLSAVRPRMPAAPDPIMSASGTLSRFGSQFPFWSPRVVLYFTVPCTRSRHDLDAGIRLKHFVGHKVPPRQLRFAVGSSTRPYRLRIPKRLILLKIDSSFVNLGSVRRPLRTFYLLSP